MSHLTHLAATGLLVCLFSLAVGVERAEPQNSLSLTLDYTSNATLAVILANGVTLTASSSATVTSPGTYQVTVTDDVSDGSDGVHMFQLSGNGVDLQTDLDGGDDKSELFTVTLEPNSVYIFKDADQPNLAGVVFDTSSTAAGSANTGSGSGGSASGTTTPTASGSQSSGGVSSNSSITATAAGAPSSSTILRGTISAVVSATGKLTLTDHGKTVTSLTAGRYTLNVDDRSPRSGFILQELTHSPLVVTTAKFVGKRKASVDLTIGQWFFYPTLLGKKTFFIVVKRSD